MAEEGEGWHFGERMVSNEAKDAGTCEAGCCSKQVWECHLSLSAAIRCSLEEGNGRNAKRLTVEEELAKRECQSR